MSRVGVKQRSGLLILISGIITGMLLMFVFTRSPGESKVEISHNMIVEKIESLGNLEVVKLSIQDIVEYKKVRRWLPNAKTALVVSGEVIGCIDLTRLRPEDIYTSGDSIRLQLPAPEICHTKIDHSKSRIFNIQYGFWDTSEVVDEAYRAAETHLREQAVKLDIDKQSRENAVTLLRPILQAMGFKHVLITFRHGGYKEDRK
ncbi:hypothetical protein GGR21_002897 [Dysgonomonas hofstadii]|uniref:DUF4230 domain-containing protein n=1 Tax=Dysgonomonas hofstadii TaxID=637886 RepID=A0A840CYH2_9BACT|nr:DUF4230 domain-containing protein [Dysgonomonas hofstadii]MBB4036983.1 hypothetical protein [Dysgonomonas hofstadii]